MAFSPSRAHSAEADGARTRHRTGFFEHDYEPEHEHEKAEGKYGLGLRAARQSQLQNVRAMQHAQHARLGNCSHLDNENLAVHLATASVFSFRDGSYSPNHSSPR